MDINSLHANLRPADRLAEEQLFYELSERFRLFLQHKVRHRQDAEDIMQDTLKTIAAKHNSITFETSFSAWAHKILTNNILHYYRTKGRREQKIAGPVEDHEADNSWQPDPGLESRLLDCLRKINRANRRHARILNLHNQGYPTGDICEKLRLSQNNLYLLLHRSRLLLKNCLETGDISK